ncbi:hypothetical protein BDZ45DRAFT_795822 [Acephala macrosclerotiorum]|nr:hypothetical protein BDZ45DRAFT_795822 [Acephala macrosclerotiorum]
MPATCKEPTVLRAIEDRRPQVEVVCRTQQISTFTVPIAKKSIGMASVPMLLAHGFRIVVVGANTDTGFPSIRKGTTPGMVSLFLDAGSDVDGVNHQGRRGEDKSLRDKERRSAVDLAHPMVKNKKERYEDADRREIVRLLVRNKVKEVAVYCSTPTASDFREYSFRRSLNNLSIVFRGPVVKYPVNRQRKTVAQLERGSPFLPIAATSRWSHGKWGSIRVSGMVWTDEVFRIAAVVGHQLDPHEYDRGAPSRWSACHAEKQLIAYFVDRRLFLPRGFSSTVELESSITAKERQLRKVIRFSDGGKKSSALRE